MIHDFKVPLTMGTLILFSCQRKLLPDYVLVLDKTVSGANFRESVTLFNECDFDGFWRQ